MKIQNNLIARLNSKEGVIFDETVEGLRMISSVKSVTVWGNSHYEVGSCLIETATKTLVLGSVGVEIPADGSVTSIGTRAFNGAEIAELVLPQSVKSIGAMAFMDCRYLKRIVLPADLEEIGVGVFCGQYFNACEFVLDEHNPIYRVESGCIIERATNKLVAAPINAVIPEGVRTIGALTFNQMWDCTEIYISASVTEFEKDERKRHPFFSCGCIDNFRLTIKSPKGSAAIEFAKQNNIKYVEV